MPSWWLPILLVVFVLVLGAWRLTYLAARLDRLHVRVEGSLASLDAQLVRRADIASELAGSGCLDPASAFLLVSAAAACLEAADDTLVTDEVREQGIPRPRLEVEEELTLALDAVAAQWEPQTPDAQEMHRRIVDACARVELAHRFHDQAVRDVRRVRSKPVVKLFRLAGHTALPAPVELQDHVPALENVATSW